MVFDKYKMDFSKYNKIKRNRKEFYYYCLNHLY